MKLTSSLTTDKTQFEDTYLLRMLDNGICDMEAGREMPLSDAFQRVAELRDSRRSGQL